MTCLAGPSRYEPASAHDITEFGNLDRPTSAARRWDLQDSLSIASEASEASNRSCPTPRPKDQMRRCLHRYKTLALRTLDASAAKEAVLWCCLGLSVAAYSLQTSPSPPSPQSPLSAESRSNSNGSINSVSDSGFAPSVELAPHHCLSIADPDIENTLTNLAAGLAGLFVSRLFGRADSSCRVPAEVGQEFDSTLAILGLARDEEVDVVLLATKIAAQLLNLIQNELGNSQSHMVNYWELCLKLAVASANEDLPTADTLATELERRTPPPSLTEPALSYLLRPHETKHGVPFPGLDLVPKLPHAAHRMSRQTRSRAASLMSHSSLRSFSSVRSLGNLSPKSPATLSLSRGVNFSQSPTEEQPPAGWFVSGPPRGSMDSLSRALHQYVHRRPFSVDLGHATTAPSSPLRPAAPTFSRSDSSESKLLKPRGKGKGKENAETGLGLRPGAEGVSARTGTRFVMTCPPTPSGTSRKPLPKMDPVLAALERGSKLKSKSVCLNCGKKGDNYPCCPRCGESWCSRVCRVEANNGGKHVCKRTAPIPSAPTL
ncbi:hypothetical protein RhiJN_20638 [Ceratobasidium sp. AG-Ba]|nr:hypothetical protein RhiJN_20638 [Ceratobasidium sp. AG-Ba]